MPITWLVEKGQGLPGGSTFGCSPATWMWILIILILIAIAA